MSTRNGIRIEVLRESTNLRGVERLVGDLPVRCAAHSTEDVLPGAADLHAVEEDVAVEADRPAGCRDRFALGDAGKVGRVAEPLEAEVAHGGDIV